MNRGVSDFSLGPHNGSVDFKYVVNKLCNMILNVSVFVSTDKPNISYEVGLIKTAVENARDSVLRLYVQDDDNWKRIVSAIVALHDMMHFYTFGSFLVDSRLINICKCMMEGTDIQDKNAFRKIDAFK
jgi:hypothetical protein